MVGVRIRQRCARLWTVVGRRLKNSMTNLEPEYYDALTPRVYNVGQYVPAIPKHPGLEQRNLLYSNRLFQLHHPSNYEPFGIQCAFYNHAKIGRLFPDGSPVAENLVTEIEETSLNIFLQHVYQWALQNVPWSSPHFLTPATIFVSTQLVFRPFLFWLQMMKAGRKTKRIVTHKHKRAGSDR